jgi:predicted Zn-dependent peptidase
MNETKSTVLDNGLRIVTDYVPSVASVATGVWVGVGTRDEDLPENGVAHLVEHMVFKGTNARNSLEIAESIENVGGHMNAYTSRELTSYHAHVLKEDVPLALDVVADLVLNATMPDEELQKERDVVLQEIGMCNDTPDDVIFDHYYETAYPDQALGAPILGRSDVIGSMPRAVLKSYVDKNYTPQNMVISAAGYVDHDAVVEQAKNLFGSCTAHDPKTLKAAKYHGGDFRLQKDLEQSHVILGFQGLDRMDENYYAAQALSSILGGGMSSRLFQEVREKRGLVYSVFSFHSAYQDDGQFGIYAGTGPDKLPELIPVVCDQAMMIANDLKDEEVDRVKVQMKAGLLMGRESMMSRADQMAKHMVFRDEQLNIAKIVGMVDALNKDQIADVANRIFASKPTMTALGPLDKLESYDSVCARLAA